MRASFFLTATLLLLSQSALAENNPRLITGYDASNATFAFARAITEDDELFNTLRLQSTLVKQLMQHRDLQDKLARKEITIAEATRLIAERATGEETKEQAAPKKQIQFSTAAAQKAAADIAALRESARRCG